jgi:serine/threonine protein kinase
MPRFEISLDDLNKEGTMTTQDKEKVVNDILDALNHLSKKGYIHLDIKAENIMRKNGRWYLIDYGMTERFDDTTETTINPKKAGNGTLWFMSRDAHKGLMSRKADLESLVYIILMMEGHKLPWQREKRKGEKDKDYRQNVFESKQQFFDTYTYKNLNLPQYCNTFIEYVDKLQPGTEPKYEALKFK